MTLDLAIIALLFITVGNYWFRRSVLYPPFIFSFMWLLVLTVYHLDLIEIDPLHSITLDVVAGGASLFSVGGLCAYLVPNVFLTKRLRTFRRRGAVGVPPQYDWIKYLLLCLTAFTVLVQIKGLLTAVSQASAYTGGSLAQVRGAGIDALNSGEVGRSVWDYLTPWVTFTCVFFQAERRDKFFYWALAIAIPCSIAGTGRIAALQLLSALTAAHLITANKERIYPAWRIIRWPLFLFIMIFVTMMFVAKDTTHISGTAAEYAKDSTVQYLVGPTGGLDYVLRHPREYTGRPNHTLKLPLQAASAIGLISYQAAPQLDTFIFIPFPTNVYTVYKYYFIDFGLAIAMVIISFLGFTHTLLYRKACQGTTLGVYFFSLTVFPVIMVVFDDMYVAIGMYINALFFGLLYQTLRTIPFRVFSPSTEPNAAPHA